MSLNELPEGWEEKELGRCASYLNGYAFKPADWRAYGIPIIRIEQLNDPDAKQDYYDKQLPDRFVLKNGDLVFSWSATLSLKLWDRGKAYLNQHLFKVVPVNNVDKVFLKYLIEFNLDRLAGETHGSTMKHITRPHLLNYKVRMPRSFNEQKRIAAVIQKIDEVIDRSKALVEKLKRIKKGLMQDLLTKGVNDDPFKSSELGKIPDSWKVATLRRLIISHQAGIYKKADLYGDGHNIVGVSDLYYHESIDGQIFRLVSLSPEELSQYTLKDGDIIYGESSLVLEGIAKSLHVTFKGGGTAFAWHTRRLVVNKELADPEFLHYLLDSESVRKRIVAVATQTALTGITTNDFFRVKVVLPPLKEQVRIRDYIRSAIMRIHGEQSYLDKVIKIKTGLMRDLLTGKVRVLT